jgi:hypothetical protein
MIRELPISEKYLIKQTFSDSRTCAYDLYDGQTGYLKDIGADQSSTSLLEFRLMPLVNGTRVMRNQMRENHASRNE